MSRFESAVVLTSLYVAGLYAQNDPLLAWLDQQAQQHLTRREEAIAQIRTMADAERRKTVVRKKLLELLGGLPEFNGPLHARLTGTLRSDTHTIEKIIFESLPGFYITANLYRPNHTGATRLPAVLVPSGHTQEGKPEPQILAANLAAKGFIALTYDPIGQGEREQTYLPQLGRPLSGGAGNEHLELGARSILIGQSVARYFIFDAKRAVDYLVSRPDVDAARLAVTGCSGGGAIATYVGAFDSRMKAVAPGCSNNTFRKLFPGPTADSEMSLPQFLSSGLDTADFAELAAPLPWLLLATTEDYFTPEGARPVYEELRRWYGLYGAEDKIRYAIGTGPHGTPRDSREEIYRWMIRWLKDGKGDPVDRPVKLYSNLELRVTSTGNVDNEPGSRKLHQIILDEFHTRRKPRPPQELAARLRELGVPSRGSPAPEVVTEAPIADTPAYSLQGLRFETEPGVIVHAKLYLPKASAMRKRPAVVVVEEKRMPVPLHVTRSQSTAAVAEAMVKAGAIVLEIEPRDSPAANDGRPFLGNWMTNERADLIGRNLAAMRAHDLLAAVDVLAARTDVDPAAIRGYARGVKGFWLLMAAAVDPRLARIWLDRTPVSFALAFESPMANQLFDAMIPGFALHWDFDDLLALMGDRQSRVLWSDPANWMNRVVDRGPDFRYRLVGEAGEGDLSRLLEEFLK